MIKEKQLVEKFIVPLQEDITFYIENYLNIFYPKVVSNTTRKVRNS